MDWKWKCSLVFVGMVLGACSNNLPQFIDATSDLPTSKPSTPPAFTPSEEDKALLIRVAKYHLACARASDKPQQYVFYLREALKLGDLKPEDVGTTEAELKMLETPPKKKTPPPSWYYPSPSVQLC